MADTKERASALLDAQALGRGPQWRVLREAIETVTEQGRALWLCGEPGIGKTVLLEQAGEFAADRGLRLLRVNGAEGEKDLPFAALHQMMWTLTPQARELPAPARAALDRALGMDPDEEAGAYTVSAATLELLALAARRRPIALLIDDLHWIDASSAEVLHFLQRRLAPVPVVMLATVWAEAVAGSDFTGVRLLDVEPLTDEGADGLLRERHPGLSGAARSRILQEAAGNPLALVELPGRLEEGERTGELPLPEHLPLGTRLRNMFARRVAVLSPSAQFTLLLCALEGREGPSPHLIAAAARAAGADGVEQDLALAEEHGLIHLDPRTAQVRFRHPLVRSALVAAAPGADRRRAHAAWADVLPRGDLRQVTHWAAATAVPDEEIARALEEAAQRAQARGGDAEAAGLLARAAGLSGTAAGRGDRLVAAALAAVRGVRIALADQLLEQAQAHGVPAAARDTLAFTRSTVRFQADGDPAPTLDLVPGVLDRLDGLPGTEPMRRGCLFLLLLIAGYTTDPRAWEAVDARLAAQSDLVRLGRDVWHDPARHAQDGAARLAELARTVTGESAEDAWLFLWSAVALDSADEHAPLIKEFARRHSYVTQALITAVCGYADYLNGHWDRCVDAARAAAAAARVRGFGMHERVHRYTEGYVAAARGDRQRVDELVAELRPWAVARGLVFVVHRVRSMEAMCALAVGDHESAYAHACAITPPGSFPAGVNHFQLVFLDLVEAAVHTGRHAEARRHVAAGLAAGMDRISPHHRFVLHAGRALASEDVDADCTALYASSDTRRWPFELARVRLYHGAWLRRHGRRAEARDQLTLAEGVFTGLNAGPWAERARQELAVCDDPAGVSALSPQELRIAELVAQGLTNREVGTRLHLSPRTVAAHLYRIYPKLGITTRAAVARALAAQPAREDRHPT
jgi:DNA-binding NarL/FixJ family response regulator